MPQLQKLARSGAWAQLLNRTHCDYGSLGAPALGSATGEATTVRSLVLQPEQALLTTIRESLHTATEIQHSHNKHNSVILLLGIYLKKNKTLLEKDICTPIMSQYYLQKPRYGNNLSVCQWMNK